MRVNPIQKTRYITPDYKKYIKVYIINEYINLAKFLAVYIIKIMAYMAENEGN